MKLLKIQRTEGFVRFSHETTGPTIKANDPQNPGKTIERVSTEARVVTAHETPLESFDKAMQALSDVVANVMETGQEWKKGVTIQSLTLSYTKSGVRSATIVFTKKLDITGEVHSLATPCFQIDDGATTAEGRRQCTEKHSKAVALMIHEAERYADGDRQQTQLKFGTKDSGDDAATNPEDGDELDLSEKEPGSGQPAADSEKPKPNKPRGAVRPPKRK